MEFNHADLFEGVADAIGDRVALVCGDGGSPTPSWTSRPTGSRTTWRTRASGPGSTSRSSSTTASSTSRRCWPR